MRDSDWIKRHTGEAKSRFALVTEPVVARIEELLNGHLSERELSKGELTSIARELVEAMTCAPPKAETER